tara:strand:- start:20482 stop:21114 length:633 start_codon:yes stop_codon:yes gene_type:complete
VSDQENTKKRRRAVKNIASEVRIRQILSAVRELLIQDGYKRLTMQKVADKAGIAVGHVQHYFPTKKILLQNMFQFVSDEYIKQYNLILEKLSTDQPEESLKAIVDYILGGVSNENVRAFSFEFWALSIRYPDGKTTMATINAHHQEVLAKLIHQISPGRDKELCGLRSIQAASLLDGLFAHTLHLKTDSKKYRRLLEDTRRNLMRLAMDD